MHSGRPTIHAYIHAHSQEKKELDLRLGNGTVAPVPLAQPVNNMYDQQGAVLAAHAELKN